MRKIVLIMVLFFSFDGKAQSWCQPGATWHHKANAIYPPVNGYYYYKYLNDTLINGKTYNKIKESFRGTNPFWGAGLIDKFLSYNYTREQNNVVYLLDDTLYNFNATIGSKWLKPRYRGDGITELTVCNAPRRVVEVIDTGHVVINSMNLKSLTLKYQVKWVETNTVTAMTTYTDIVCQKIGSLKKGFTPESCETMSDVGPTMHQIGFSGLTCYQDNNFALYETPGFENTCANIYVLGLTDNLTVTHFKLYPNPASEIVQIQNLNGSKSYIIHIVNYLGELVYSQKFDNDSEITSIKISDFPKGIYFANLTDADLNTHSQKLIVE
jgi:hypothetical protein